MKKISILSQFLFAAALFLAAPPCQAKIPTQQGNRFLFVVDTAYAMRGCSNAVAQNVVELLTSDMQGEFRRGDTIGLWTYNDTLHPEFPMQIWSQARKSAIVADTAAFLQKRRYEKQAHLEKVMSALNLVIKSSERITVILIFDGTGLIQGTPFDKDIRDLQKKYARELRAAHEPFVIVLAAHDGSVFDYTINYPGLIAIPHTAYPEPEKPAETNAPVAVIAPPVINTPPRPRSGLSIIMSAAAPPPAVVAAPVTQPASQTVVVPVPMRPAPVVNTPAPPPVVPVAPVPVIQPVIAAAPPQTQPVPPPVVVQQNPPPASETPPPTAPPVSVTPHVQQPPVAPPVAQNAPVANISPPSGTPLMLFIMAFSLLMIALVLVVFMIRRSRNAPHSSLITQSIDHPR